MHIALGLPSRVTSASGEMMLEWISRAEAGPFSSVVVTDRVVSQALEPLAVLAMAAGATKRIGLMTSVVIGPTRETTLLARQAATIETLSGGRLTLGVGIGVRKNDYLASATDFHRRGRSSEKQYELLRRLWSGAELSADTGPIGPPAVRNGGPELLIGGYVPAIVERIAKWGDGYMAPGGGEPEAMLKTGRIFYKHGKSMVAKAAHVGSAPAISPSAPMPRIMRSTTLTTITATTPNSPLNDCALCRPPVKPSKQRSSARPTWASTNSSCAPAPKTWTKWIGSPKSRRRSNEKIPSHHEGTKDTKVSQNLNSELSDLRVFVVKVLV